MLRQGRDLEFYMNFFCLRNKKEKIDIIENMFNHTGTAYSVKPCAYFSSGVYKRICSFIPIPYHLFCNTKADIYHFFNFIAPPCVQGKVVLSVHDMVYKDHPETTNNTVKFLLNANMEKSLKRADIIVVGSEFTRKRLHHYFNIKQKRVEIIPNGVDFSEFNTEVNNKTLETVKKKYNISGEYFLYIGTVEPRKNLERLIYAYAQFAEKNANPPALVIGGAKGWLTEKIYSACKTVEVLERGEVIFTGYLPREEIPVLMHGAMAFCFPSIYEGFGIPVLEAMACGTPVITANVSSLPEVAGDAAYYVDPFDIKDISGGLDKVYKNSGLRREMSQKGIKHSKNFSWDIAAKKLIDLYSEAVK